MLLIALSLGVFLLFLPHDAKAETQIGGLLTQSQTWTKAQSPYIVQTEFYNYWWQIPQGSGLGLDSGITLTIEPGVIVKFEQGASLDSYLGNLVVNGTPEDPVIFTSLVDDSVGGDTNGDGGTTSPQKSFWGAIRVRYPNDKLEHAKIRYGVECVVPSGEVNIRFNQIESCQAGIAGRWGYSGTIEENTFTDNFLGIYLSGAEGAKILKNQIIDNPGDGVSVGYGIFSQWQSGDILVSGNEIARNQIGIYFQYPNNSTVEQNNISDNSDYGVLGGNSYNHINARNNWWGDPSGPFNSIYNPQGSGDRAGDAVDFDPWLDKQVTIGQLDPVIIIPGITGTELFYNAEKIWLDQVKAVFSPSDDFLDVLSMDDAGSPLFEITTGEVTRSIDFPIIDVPAIDVMQGLIDELRTAGYEEGQNLFIFPYDWREHISESAQSLNEFINNNILGQQKIDIIAHSMGGLVIKKYLLDFGNEKIDKLIFAGTPHTGSPKSAKTLIFGDPLVPYIPVINYSTIKEIARNMPAIYELLPDENYFDYSGYLKSNSNLLNYDSTKNKLTELGANSHLIEQAELFHSSGIDEINLRGIDAYNINGCNQATMAAFGVNEKDIRLPISPQFLQGDGTVPLRSSTYIAVPGEKTFFAKKIKHSTMMSEEPVRELIKSILTRTEYSHNDIIQDGSQCKIKGKVLSVFSPLDIKIFDQQQNYTGPNEFESFTGNIPGVTYEILGEEKFVFLPTDEGQTYQIELDATDTGTFDLKIADIDGEVINTAYYNQVTITPDSQGHFEISATSNDTQIEFDFKGDGNFTVLPASSILDSQQSMDETPPATTISISGLAGLNNWYRSIVEVTLNPTDDNSDILKTEYSLDNGQTWNKYEEPILFPAEGLYSIQYYSTDRAGNREEIYTQEIKIDWTAPEVEAWFDIQLKDLKFAGFDDLSELIQVTAESDTVVLTDEAGNTTTLILGNKQLKPIFKAKLEQISYNGSGDSFPNNKLQFQWFLDPAGNLIRLIQSLKLENEFNLTLDYSTKDNQTRIIFNDDLIETKPGQVILKIKINKGEIWYEY